MKKDNYSTQRIFMVLIMLSILSLACGLSEISAKTPTPIPMPTEILEATDAATLAPEDTAIPKDAAAPETATPDARVTNSNTTEGMIDNMMQDPLLASSNADDVLKKDVLKTLVDNTYKEGCTYGFSKVTLTKVPPKGVVSPWAEEWVMTICDKLTTLAITFTPDGSGGTNYKINVKK